MKDMSESYIVRCSIAFGNGPEDIVKPNETLDATQGRSSSAFLNSNTRYWLENKTFSAEEAILRFHHQLTKILPFTNGNGRHARMIADVVAVTHGCAEFTWGAGKDLVAEGHARIRYLAALRALDADENEVKPLLDFARS
jgi:fido (protein-threonine AMPylation protein)